VARLLLVLNLEDVNGVPGSLHGLTLLGLVLSYRGKNKPTRLEQNKLYLVANREIPKRRLKRTSLDKNDAGKALIEVPQVNRGDTTLEVPEADRSVQKDQANKPHGSQKCKFCCFLAVIVIRTSHGRYQRRRWPEFRAGEAWQKAGHHPREGGRTGWTRGISKAPREIALVFHTPWEGEASGQTTAWVTTAQGQTILFSLAKVVLLTITEYRHFAPKK
jgi:hypothetical protein